MRRPAVVHPRLRGRIRQSQAFCLFLLASTALTQAQARADTYIGSKACFGCHAAIYKSFKESSMGRSLMFAKDWTTGALSGPVAIAQPGTSRSFSVTHSGSAWRETESEPGVFSVGHQLDYAVGSGTNGVTFLLQRGRYLFQAPLSYYSRAEKWDLSPGYEQADLGFNRKVPEECINCHAGRPSPLKNVSGAYADPPFQELAIGCENCHGPGDRHVGSAGKLAASIVNPAKLPPRLAENICLNCHQAGDARVLQPGKSYLDFRPGQWLFDTAIIFKQPVGPATPPSELLEHFSGMQASRCFRESAGKLSCMTCHDPHTQPRKQEVAAYYRPKCLSCHTEQSCRIALSNRNSTIPADDCVGCHMPKRNVTNISHSALTNHRIPARDSEPIPPLRQDERDGLVVVNPPASGLPAVSKVVLLRAYQQLAQKAPEYRRRYLSVLDDLKQTQPQDLYVQAALGDRALADGHFDEAVEYLNRALPLGSPALYLELAQALAKAGRDQEAIEHLKKGVELDPNDAVMQKTLILQYINKKSYAEARSLMTSYVKDFPEDTLMRSLLTRVSK